MLSVYIREKRAMHRYRYRNRSFLQAKRDLGVLWRVVILLIRGSHVPITSHSQPRITELCVTVIPA